MDASAKLYLRPLHTRLAEALADTPVVALLGPRQCGKSTLAQLGSPGRNYVSFDDETLLRTAELLNTSSLSQDLGLDRQTVENYLTILERLFLVRRLPAWHRNEAKRLIKTPKIHLLDSGLAATLAGLNAADWNTRRDRFGHLLESFVVQQLVAQASWTDSDLRFWHYRDKDQVEVDLVITRGRHTWGVEVKASATVHESDGAGLRRLADQCGKDFKGGVLFHSGTSTLPLADPRFLAVPLDKLWTL